MTQQPQTFSTKFNPWLEILYRPRTTIRRIIQLDPKRGVYLLAGMAGYAQFLDNAMEQTLGNNMGLLAILGLGLLVGPIAGIISLAVSTFVVGFVARRLGGAAESEDTMAALAWAQVPAVVTLALAAIQILIFGGDIFKSEIPLIETNPALAIIFIPIAAAGILILLWQLILTVLTVAEANRFSIWRSIATLLISALVVVVPFAVCFLAVR
jgi:hypothetical protein